MARSTLALAWFAVFSALAMSARTAVAQDAQPAAPQQGDGGVATPPSVAPALPPAGEADAGASALPPGPAFPAPVYQEPSARRTKPLRISIGLLPTASDLGSEADLVSTADNDAAITESLKKWTFSLKGYIRAPVRIGWGPSCHDRSDLNANRLCSTGETPHTELHSPPRMVGFSSGDWEYVGLAPNTSSSLRVTVSNPLVSANVIFAANTFWDSGFMELDQIGGIDQAYLTLKFPNAFGSTGGLAWTVGSFSNRYGNAGPNQTSSGYYGTYLVGRTHVMGEDLTADIDLNDDMELVLEHGIGAKLDISPFIAAYAPQPSFYPGQGHVPHGSNFLHHAHAALIVSPWLQLGAHYMTSWTPDDNTAVRGLARAESRLTVTGADVHLDDDEWGHAYVGYSHVDAKNLAPLDEALQVIHGGDGYNFKLEYFGDKDRRALINRTPTNDAGTVDTVLFQYIVRLAPLIDGLPIHDIAVAAYGMYNHVHVLQTHTLAVPRVVLGIPTFGDGDDPEYSYDRLKIGAEVEFALLKYLSMGFRVDRVMPDLRSTDASYTALSPRAIIHTTWKSKEYIIVDYTHFFLGQLAFPSSPYSSLTTTDPDMLMVSAIMSF
jgi:hypothetical protein